MNADALRVLEAVRTEKAALLARVEAAQQMVRESEAAVARAKSQAGAEMAARPPPPPAPTEASELQEAAGGELEPCAPLAPALYTATLQPSATALPPRAALDVRFAVAAPAGAAPRESDFIALYRGSAGPATPAAAHSEHCCLEYTDAELQGSRRLRLPSTPGPLCVCYIAACGTVLCCAPIACQAPAPQAPAAAAAVAKPARKAASRAAAGGAAAPPRPCPPLPAPFLLETQPRISTYQLTVPLPAQLRGPPLQPSQAAAAPPSAGQAPLQYLPRDWAPGLAVEGDHSDAAGATAPCALILGLQLPRCQGHPAYAFSALAHPALPTAMGPPAAPPPSDVYALRIPLSRRVESSKVITTVHSDHVAVRLPMYFAGSAVPDKPPSLVSLEEMASLRAHARLAACRFCAAPLLAPGSSSSSSSARLRAVKLPSEHWLEWTDFWVCHDAEDNVLLPKDGAGDHCSIRGTVLVGESVLQLHPEDIAPGAVVVAVAAAAACSGSAAGAAGDTAALECARCRCVIGALALPQAAGGAAGAGAACAADAVQCLRQVTQRCLGSPVHAWPHSLTSSLHPTIKLHKDALCIPSAPVPAARGSPTPTPTSTPTRPAPHPNALHCYTLTSRLACSMLAAASALRHYSFAVIVGDGPAAPEFLCHIGLLNWNTSVRVGLGCSGGAAAEAVRARWVHTGDLPCLKVRYRWDGGAWGGGGVGAVEPQVLSVTREEARELAGVLQESTSFLPPSQRALEGASIGFLPFMAAPLRLVTH